MSVTLNGRASRRSMTILDCVSDKQIFGRHFRNPKSWAAWRSFLAVLFGLKIDQQQLEVFRQCTGRDQPNPDGYREGWLVCGRRSGKSFTLALIAVYLAAFKDWRPYLNAGEVASIVVVAADRKQARVIMRYVKGLLNGSPMLRSLIEAERAESIDLSNNVCVEVHAASYRTVRGYSICACLLDELAFWSVDENAAEPDTEILAALRPAMASIPDAMLLCASSPYSRKGALWTAYNKNFGKDSPALIWRAATTVMNPSIPQSVIDEAMEQDPASASAEFLAQFRTDIEGFVNLDAVLACVDRGIYERPPRPGLRYTGFVDTSGSGADAFTMAVAHRDADSLFLDALREQKPPFSPESVVADFAMLLKTYNIRKITGDKFAGAFPVEGFRRHGITFEQSAAPKSDLYRDVLPLINSRRVSLLDHPKMINQFVGLERRTARSGRDSIDHPANQHDDLCNAAAGALCAAAVRQQRMRYWASGSQCVEWDLQTGRKIEPPEIHGADRNGCRVGRVGLKSEPWLEATAVAFNSKHNISRPR